MYDVAIIGGGPAGCSAAIYAARKKMKTVFITDSFGGQSVVSDDIQNWIGEPHISGYDLAKKIENHVRAYEGDDLHIVSELATMITTTQCFDPSRQCDFEVRTAAQFFTAKTLIIATGSGRRKLGVPGEAEFNGKGVAYCSTCDAPLFRGKEVAVIGGGNAGLEAAIDLLPYAQTVYILERGDSLRGDPVTQAELLKKGARILLNAAVESIHGAQFVERLAYTDTKTSRKTELAVQGIFVEIGSAPNSDLVRGLVDIDAHGQIIIDPLYASTSLPGVFAAGDVTNDPFKQNNIAAGDAIRAALGAYAYIQQRPKISPAAS